MSGDTSSKVAAARLSIYSNVFLTVAKLVVGILGGSVSVISEAAHSANDLVASAIAFWSVRVADRPADEHHPYGHGKVESLSGMVEALLIMGAAIYIVYEAVMRILHGGGEPQVVSGIVVMAISATVNYGISTYLFRIAEATDSLALAADAEHLRTDVVTSVGVLIGLMLVRITGWTIIDPIAAIAVALLIGHASLRLTRSALQPLVDTRLPETDLALVRAVLDEDPRVHEYHKLRSRKAGSYRHIDVHILVEDDLSLLDAHALTEELEDQIESVLPNSEVMIHTEPYSFERQHQHEHHGGPPPQA